MEKMKLMIIDGSHMNLICSLETYVNERLSDLYENSKISDIKLVEVSRDYFVFSYILMEEGASDVDWKPP